MKTSQVRVGFGRRKLRQAPNRQFLLSEPQCRCISLPSGLPLSESSKSLPLSMEKRGNSGHRNLRCETCRHYPHHVPYREYGSTGIAAGLCFERTPDREQNPAFTFAVDLNSKIPQNAVGHVIGPDRILPFRSRDFTVGISN